MDIKKIHFSSYSGNGTKNTFKKYEPIFVSLINDNSTDFENYNEVDKDVCSITVKRDSNWDRLNTSYFIYWYREVNQGRYLRIGNNKELSLGYKFNSEAYVEFFITEEYYSKHEKALEPKIIRWTNGLESFVDSSYVQKNKLLLKHLNWRGEDTCLPEYLFIDFNINGLQKKLTIIKQFEETYNIKEFKEFIKIINKE